MRIAPSSGAVVTATPRWLTEIRAGRAFVGGSSVAAGGIGTFAEAQLLNPAGSLITVVVHRVLVTVQANATVEVRRFDTALAVSNGTGINLLVGGAAGVGQFRQAVPAVQDGTSIVPALAIGANNLIPLITEWGFELAAGRGVVIELSTANIALQVMWELMEL